MLRIKLILSSIRRFAGDRLDLRVCEIGSGRGVVSASLFEQGYENIIAVEPALSAVEQHKLLFPNVPCLHGDSREAVRRFGAGSFQCAVSTEVLEHVPYKEQSGYLHDINILLETGGILVLTTPRLELKEEWSQVNKHPQPLEDWVSERQLKHLLINNKFQILSKGRLYMPFLRLDWVDKLLSCRFVSSLPDMPVLSAVRNRYALYQYVVSRK